MQVNTLDAGKAVQQNPQSAQGMQVSPPECQSIMTAAMGNASNFQGVGMIATSKTTDPAQFATITELVLAKTASLDIGTMRTNLQKCGNATVTMGPAKATSTVQEIPLTGIHADQSFGISQQVKMSGLPNGASGLSTQMALLVVGNKTVTLAVAGNPGGVTLTDLANKAVAKAQNA